MTVNNPLIVPMAVEALVVNDAVRENANGYASFVRAQMQYGEIHNDCTGMGNAQATTANNDTNFIASGDMPNSNITASDFYNGVYLKWRLPRAFTRGRHAAGSADTRYPLVPNRWLIVRYGGTDPARRNAMAWIVESDYVWSLPLPTAQNAAQLTTSFMSNGTKPAEIQIGRNVDVAASPWSESGHSLKLTAMGPGNPAFAAYQPQCNNVFSFIDCLNGQPAQALSYAVYGWFSSAADDPLASLGGTSFPDRLAALGWTLPKGTDPNLSASWSLLCGAVNGVQWQAGSMPEGGVPRLRNGQCPISIAVGNTSAEALTALITAQDKSIQADFLNAFQLDLLDLLDRPDGEAELADRLKASFFQKYSGGYSWTIVDAPDGTAPVSPEQSSRERQWLATLNQDQAALDQAILEFAEWQRALYVMWWKSIQPHKTVLKKVDGKLESVPVNLSQPDRSYFQDQLDLANRSGLAWQVAQQSRRVQQLLTRVPHGDTPADLRSAIATYARGHGLPSARMLKRQAAPAYFLPNDPVVLITGVGASRIARTPDSVECRFPSQLVSGFTWRGRTITAQTAGLTIPQPDLSKVTGAPWDRGLLHSLMVEFFFLDAGNAGALDAAVPGSGDTPVSAANAAGTFPDAPAYRAWTQNPWRPLLLFWEANYYPIGYGTATSPNWTFNGSYAWNNANAAVGATMSLSGMLQLAPTAAKNLDSRIAAFLANNPNLSECEKKSFQDLRTFIQEEKEGDLLSQALDGFNSQLRLALPGVYLSPTSSSNLAGLIGNTETKPPDLQAVDCDGKPPPSNFQAWRAGQFEFTSLVAVDEWGQALWPITDQDEASEKIFMPADLTPTFLAPDNLGGTALSGNAPPDTGHCRLQLPPALLQPARLDFSLVSANDDGVVCGNANPGADAICGWVVPNHLDASIMAFDATGGALGEMRVDAANRVVWLPLPGCPAAFDSLEKIAAGIPHLGPFLSNLCRQGATIFNAFMGAIDETLWTTVPTGSHFDRNLSILMGRPLAMVRARLQFLLDGAPYPDPSWQYTQRPATPELPSYRFAVELGNIARLEDGLVGYFTQNDYGTFHIVAQASAPADGYLNTIGTKNNYIYLPFDGKTSMDVSMLVDPRAAVHATTSILPVETLRLPPQLVAGALGEMAMGFRVDGILADQIVDKSNTQTLLMPTPKVNRGAWSWHESDQTGWTACTVGPVDPMARLSNVPPILRRGYLQLSKTIKERK